MTFEELNSWFLKNKREFPWREEPTPYRVWISEVMLQQTRAAVVIEYFNRWMEQFPTINHLAQSPLPKVIKAWEGLGYYSRARNLHLTAQILVKQYGGILPATYKELIQLPGIGEYTAGAILSFAYRQRAFAIDGNVLRVLARYYAIEEDIQKPATKALMEKHLESNLPQKAEWVTAEALIELGATICQKAPKCLQCPLKKDCRAHGMGMTERFPFKSKKGKTIHLTRIVLCVLHQSKVLIMKNAEKTIMQDLYEFPYVDDAEKKKWKKELLKKEVNPIYIGSLNAVSHCFTNYKANLFPEIWEVEHLFNHDLYIWMEMEELKKHPFSAGHRKIAQDLLEKRKAGAKS